jgi:hypothetical protein
MHFSCAIVCLGTFKCIRSNRRALCVNALGTIKSLDLSWRDIACVTRKCLLFF